MAFDEFLKNGKVIKKSPDLQKAKALAAMSAEAMRATKALPLNGATASIITSAAYSSLRQLLEAMCLQKGYHVYSHEAFTHYLKMIGEGGAAGRFDILRKRRNGIEYYGKAVDAATARESVREAERLRKLLKKHVR